MCPLSLRTPHPTPSSSPLTRQPDLGQLHVPFGQTCPVYGCTPPVEIAGFDHQVGDGFPAVVVLGGGTARTVGGDTGCGGEPRW